mgnify:CR=1 FL=1
MICHDLTYHLYAPYGSEEIGFIFDFFASRIEKYKGLTNPKEFFGFIPSSGDLTFWTNSHLIAKLMYPALHKAGIRLIRSNHLPDKIANVIMGAYVYGLGESNPSDYDQITSLSQRIASRFGSRFQDYVGFITVRPMPD